MAIFEWDENKNKTNEEKHGISFNDARKVFEDTERIQYINTTKNERRFITIGKVIKFIIAVVYTVRSGALRIISARQANRNEINDYLKNKLNKNG